jgi:hypothetical protein
MSGKPTVKNELIEELMEAVAIQGNFSQDLEEVLKGIETQEKLDHDNDKIRNEATRFLLNALEAYNAKDYEGMQKFTHAGVQKLHEQAEIDFKDDQPRVDIKIKLSQIQYKAVLNQERITRMIKKLGRKNAGS